MQPRVPLVLLFVGLLIAGSANATSSKTKTKTMTAPAQPAAPQAPAVPAPVINPLPVVANGKDVWAMGADSKLFKVFCDGGIKLGIVDMLARSDGYIFLTDSANMYLGNSKNGTEWKYSSVVPNGSILSKIVASMGNQAYVSGWLNSVWYLWRWDGASNAFAKLLCNGCSDGTSVLWSDYLNNATIETTYPTHFAVAKNMFFYSNSTGFFTFDLSSNKTETITADTMSRVVHPDDSGDMYVVTQGAVPTAGSKLWAVTPGTPTNTQSILDGTNKASWPNSLASWAAPLTIKHIAADKTSPLYAFVWATDSNGAQVRGVLTITTKMPRTISVSLVCYSDTNCTSPTGVFMDAGKIDTMAAFGIQDNIAYIGQDGPTWFARWVTLGSGQYNLTAHAALPAGTYVARIGIAPTDIDGPTCSGAPSPAPSPATPQAPSKTMSPSAIPRSVTMTPNTPAMPSSPSASTPGAPTNPSGSGPSPSPGTPTPAGPQAPQQPNAPNGPNVPGAPGMAPSAAGNCSWETERCLRAMWPNATSLNVDLLLAGFQKPVASCNVSHAPIYNCMRLSPWRTACSSTCSLASVPTEPTMILLLNSPCTMYGCNTTLALPVAAQPEEEKENIGLWIGIGAAVLVGAIALGGLVVWQMRKKAALAQKTLANSFQQPQYDTEYGQDSQYTQQNDGYTDNQTYNEGSYDDYNNEQDGDGYDDYGYDQTQTQN